MFDALIGALVKSAGQSNEFTTLVMMSFIAVLCCVVVALWKFVQKLNAKNDDLHKENQDLLREMLEHAEQYGTEKTRLMEEMNKTLALIFTAAPQLRRDNTNG